MPQAGIQDSKSRVTPIQLWGNAAVCAIGLVVILRGIKLLVLILSLIMIYLDWLEIQHFLQFHHHAVVMPPIVVDQNAFCNRAARAGAIIASFPGAAGA